MGLFVEGVGVLVWVCVVCEWVVVEVVVCGCGGSGRARLFSMA